MLLTLKISSFILLFASVVTMVNLALTVPVPMGARLGYRGVQRRRALAAGGLFVLVEPLLRFLAGLMRLLPLDKFRSNQERNLMRSDFALGLTADELMALSLLSAVSLGAVVFGLTASAGENPWAFGFLALCFGGAFPTIRLREAIRSRVKEITRGLPQAIEVAAMCMGAGLDFPAALRQLAGAPQDTPSALAREFSVILEQLDLGHTRKAALRHFAERVPSDAVRDFVNAVIQAEEKGNPLAKVIQVQGRILGMRRSVAAEEAAARAGVLMILPMMLLVFCILLLLMGPFMVQGMGF